jgi:acyl-CoA thioester hydrolase
MPRFVVGWGDLDGNNHLANTAILDRAADARLMLFAERGFPGTRFSAEGVGPVIVRDELVYRKELRLLEEFDVDVAVVGLSADGVRWSLRNTLRNASGEVTCIVTSEGVWFDLVARKPRAPPPALDAIQRSLPKGPDFRELPNRSP